MTFLCGSLGFLPPIFQEKFLVSNLEAIISAKAVGSSILSNIRKETDIEITVLQLLPMNFHGSSGYVYLSIIATFLYSQWFYYDGFEQEKLRKIDKYVRVENFIKNILFVIVLVFVKDVASAT